MNPLTDEQRILGGLYGSLVGDALGVPVEFAGRTARQRDPVTGMRGHGTHNQPAGTWSDDGALLLCSVESLIERGFDTQDMGERFVRWLCSGLWTAHGTIFDIGFATRKALTLIEEGTPAERAGGKDEHSNGNGSLMRILPVALSSRHEPEAVFVDRIERASAITHGHERSRLACVLHGLVVRGLMNGLPPSEALKQAQICFAGSHERHAEFPHFKQAMSAELAEMPECDIGSSGYVLDTLTASIWCLLTTDSFADCVLKAVNLGEDTDTTGCVAGGLAGVAYGLGSIPADWQAALPRQDDLHELFQGFLQSLTQTRS